MCNIGWTWESEGKYIENQPATARLVALCVGYRQHGAKESERKDFLQRGNGSGVELTDPRHFLGTGTFLSEHVAACEDGSLADQIALALALRRPSQGSVSGLPAAPGVLGTSRAPDRKAQVLDSELSVTPTLSSGQVWRQTS